LQKVNLTAESKIVFVGNKKSLLFGQRVEQLIGLLHPKGYTVIDTGNRTFSGVIKFICIVISLFLSILTSGGTTHLILHGAYSPVLWPLLFLRRVRVVSIVQGSELTVDFVGVRAYLITIILQRSILVVCRNQVQIEEVIRLCITKRERCVIVNWGLNKELLELSLPHRSGDPILISPRATQREYNIPVILAAIAKLKKNGYRLRFIYVRFNSTFALEDTSAADEILEAPTQNVLWERMAQADLCISVPNYDGLSNTILEALALGSTPLYSDLPPYAFLKGDDRLGIRMELGDSFDQNVQRLYASIQNALLRIEELRLSATFRRDFIHKIFSADSGVDRIVSELRND
jgi:hypothetical protein